jgi:hypothetical protein
MTASGALLFLAVVFCGVALLAFSVTYQPVKRA